MDTDLKSNDTFLLLEIGEKFIGNNIQINLEKDSAHVYSSYIFLHKHKELNMRMRSNVLDTTTAYAGNQ